MNVSAVLTGASLLLLLYAIYNAYLLRKMTRAILDDWAKREDELDRLKLRLENHVSARTKAMEREVLNMKGQVAIELQKIREKLIELEALQNQLKNEMAGFEADLTVKREVLLEDLKRTNVAVRELEERVGRVHLALLDFERRTSQLGKDLNALSALLREVMAGEKEGAPEEHSDKAEGGGGRPENP